MTRKAKGVKMIGMCCTVNEALMRKGVSVATNHLHQELAVMTGAIEAVVVDVQCILPSMINLTRCFHTKFITTSDQALFPGAIHIQYDEQSASRVSREVVMTAINAFSSRNPAKVNIPQEVMQAQVGYGIEELSRHLGGSLQPLADALKDGSIRGIVAIVGCNNPKLTQDYLHVTLAHELLQQGVLVVGSAPEWTTEKALTIGTYFAASGIPVHLGHNPPIGGSREVTRILTEDLHGLLGGTFLSRARPFRPQPSSSRSLTNAARRGQDRS